jgi:hypothetical protein
MWFDIPVLALNSSAVPETAGEAAMLFDRDADSACRASLAHELISDQAVRQKVIAAQRHRRRSFVTDRVRPSLRRLVSALLNSKSAPQLLPSGS